MNTKILDLLLYLFFGMSVLVGGFRFVQTKGWRSLAPKQILPGWKPFALSIAPTTALLVAGNLCGIDTREAAPYFAAAAFVAFVLSQIGLQAELRSLLLLALAVGFTRTLGSEYAQPLLGVTGGLLVWKVVENLLHKPESRLDDVAAAIIWLSTFYWSKAAGGDESSALCQEVVLATLTVANLIRGIQPLLLARDPIFLKRLVLSIVGWLAMLILVTKVLLNDTLETTALLAGAGFFSTYLLQALNRSEEEGSNLSRALGNIFLIGIMTLAATRLFGLQGLLVLAAATTIAPQPGPALIAGLFFASRVFLQAYVIQYNSNVTGINLMHNYSSAALYAGFLLAAVAGLLIKDLKDRRLLTMIYVATMFIGPAAVTYFLHAEPTGSLLVSVGVAAVLMTLLAPALYPTQSADQENLILVPTLATVVAALSQKLLELGDNATTEDRVIALSILAAVIVCLALIYYFVTLLGKRRTTNTATDAQAS